MYTWVKAEGGGRMPGKFPTLGIPQAITQDGPKHYLLCDPHEQYMNVSETYVRALMCGEDADLRAIGVAEFPRVARQESRRLLVGVNLSVIQRFLLGTAFRAHHSTAAETHSFALPADQVERVRLAVLHGVARDDEFPIIGIQYVSARVPDADPKAFVFPMMVHVPGYAPAFRLFAAGWEWCVFFCGDDPTGAGPLFDLRLLRGEPYVVQVHELIEHPNLRAFMP
jgi:hypothetical protein